MITIVSGLPRSGTSLAMQMLKAGGFPIHYNREPNYDAKNPHGYYEWEQQKSLWQSSGETCKSLFAQIEGKAVKIFPQCFPCLSPGFDYRIIYIDRPLGEVICSQRDMQEFMHRDPNEVIPSALEKFRYLALTYCRAFPSIIIPHKSLYNGDGEIAIANFVWGVGGASNTRVIAMGGVVNPTLRHF